MKIAISYPPLESPKGIPLLSQNRQFQWFNNPTYIYPMVPAYAATMLKQNGFEVFWDDAIAEGLTYNQWSERIKKEKPDLIVIETKTPVVKRHWQIIKDLKNLETDDWKLMTVLMGDHVTALPEESLQNSPVDFVLTGGNYDFLLLNLCNSLKKDTKSKIQNELETGIWYRDKGKIKNTGPFHLNHDLNSLPLIDRDITKWELYAYRNGNFKYTPGTYTMAARDCWWGRCHFCSWTTLYPGKDYQTRSPDNLLQEIDSLINNYAVKEIFDDSGCFPNGEWLTEFCHGMIEARYNNKVTFGCNTRIGAITEEQFHLMKKANFRFLLIGLESVNQKTLERLNKNIEVEQIIKFITGAKTAGLEPHLTVMTGYPWESKADTLETLKFAKYMFKKGYIDSLQATIVVPYPGTPMFEEARQKGWLKTENWDKYDMRESVWHTPIESQEIKRLTQGLYLTALNPYFILKKICSIRKVDDLKFLFRSGIKFLGHILDFRTTKQTR